jgi:hemerythrin
VGSGLFHIPAAKAEHEALLETLNGAVEGLATNGDIDAFARGLRKFVDAADAHVAGEEHSLTAERPALRPHQRQRFAETADALLGSLTTRYDLFDCWAVALYFLRWLSNHMQGAQPVDTQAFGEACSSQPA